jgi:geranylgeranylglycerol-phosphate geranylgeranyltransferase
MNRINSYFLISRPVNFVITFLSVLIAAAVTGTIQPFDRVFMACMTAVLITIGANVINDYFDYAIDLINKPGRPIPAGIISRPAALTYSITTYILAWIIAGFLGIDMFLIALFTGLLLIVYSWWLKRTVLLGNLAVSLATAMAFVYGGSAVGRPSATFFPALFAFLFHFGREILKDLQDVKGDAVHEAITFAVRYGRVASLLLITTIFTVLLVCTIIPYIVSIYGHKYLLIILSGVYPVILYVIYGSWKYSEPEKLGLLSNILKADMVIGLLAIYMG